MGVSVFQKSSFFWKKKQNQRQHRRNKAQKDVGKSEFSLQLIFCLVETENMVLPTNWKLDIRLMMQCWLYICKENVPSHNFALGGENYGMLRWRTRDLSCSLSLRCKIWQPSCSGNHKNNLSVHPAGSAWRAPLLWNYPPARIGWNRGRLRESRLWLETDMVAVHQNYIEAQPASLNASRLNTRDTSAHAMHPTDTSSREYATPSASINRDRVRRVLAPTIYF